jgi:hypothetical protein
MSDARPSEPQGERTRVEGDRHEYEPPALVALGSLEELTSTKPVGTGDMTTMSVVASDRALKERVEPADGEAVLAALRELPISRWSYWGDATAAPHIGPMAQDFKAAFGVGSDERRIHVIDGQGVALAAIQALERRLRDQQTELDELRRQLGSG